MPTRLHPHAHPQSLRPEIVINLFGFLTVLQTTLLERPSVLGGLHHQSQSGVGADIVKESIPPTTLATLRVENHSALAWLAG
jgi:hypothetical protein